MARTFLLRRQSHIYWILCPHCFFAGGLCLAAENSAVFCFPKGVMDMKKLEQKILAEGKVLPGHILKVGGFLNQQIDVPFMNLMGREIASLYKEAGVTKVLTVEASGLPFAFAIASAMDVPMVFAKKNSAANVSGDVYSALVHSYTHNKDYTIVVSKDYISASDKVLIADDFLACGNAIRGLLSMCREADAQVAGCAIAIEKGFQGGGDALRAEGIRVESLAILESMTDDSVVFRD